ncbi:methyltransferase domain-containing protein [Chloroflexi bacterium TSY]|nr:methyltransferase domain-containing protein [Chloroflexi bacterium TSY]
MSSQIHQGQIAGTRWDPNQYGKFSDHRLRPALELLDRVPIQSPNVIYDLGCGSGQVTRLISERWPSATVYGLDNSQEMLVRAAANPKKVQWIEADIGTWSPDEPLDLIYSNATLHWVAGHQELFPRLVGYLRPGGCLAVQMPLSWNAPSHRLMRETLANGRSDGKALGTEELRQAVARQWVADTEVYYDLLASSSGLDIWETEYLQILEGDNPVLEWVKGTGLRPILNSLGDKERECFLVEYAQRLRAAYPIRADGRTLYPFRRLFIVATV